jgi:hypothetical protein
MIKEEQRFKMKQGSIIEQGFISMEVTSGTHRRMTCTFNKKVHIINSFYSFKSIDSSDHESEKQFGEKKLFN